MATPNPDYSPAGQAINKSPVYLDGWETTLTAEWDGVSDLPVAAWIGLDTYLKSSDQTHAILTIETPSSAQPRYRQLLYLYSDGLTVTTEYYGNLATDAPPDGFLFPAGSRVYMSLSADDLQKVFNNRLAVLSYFVVNGQWVGLESYQTVFNPNGTVYQFPAVGSNTGLILLTYPKARGGQILLSATLLTLPGTWCTKTSW